VPVYEGIALLLLAVDRLAPAAAGGSPAQRECRNVAVWLLAQEVRAMRVAVVHVFEVFAGAERVTEQILDIQ
jgi:hypothetical protein